MTAFMNQNAARILTVCDCIRDHVAANQTLTLRPIDSGHFPQREKPQLLARMIEQFADASWCTP